MHLMDLLGNKIDFDINKKVNYEDGYSFGEEKRITFFEISSKRGRGIVDVFQNFFENVGNYFKDYIQNNPEKPKNNFVEIPLNYNPEKTEIKPKEKSDCCGCFE